MVGSRAIEAAGRHFFSDEKFFTEFRGTRHALLRACSAVKAATNGDIPALYITLFCPFVLNNKNFTEKQEFYRSEQVVDLRSFFFFGTFFFLCGEIEFLGKMGITLNTYKKNYNILHAESNCSFMH